MELLILGLAVGGVLGVKGKTIVKAATKGYLSVTERTRGWSSNLREDFRDAVEEARYEHVQEQNAAASEADQQNTEVPGDTSAHAGAPR